MTETLRDLRATDVPALDALLRRAYGVALPYASRLRAALANPRARTLVIDGAGGPLAMGTLHDYDRIGYVALMGVEPAAQRRGLGRTVLDGLLAISRGYGHTVVALEASDAGRALYLSAGFVMRGETGCFTGPCVVEPTDEQHVRRATREDADLLGAYDAVSFGGDRSATVRAFFDDPDAAVLIADDGHRVGGYVVARDGKIGPWIAQTPAIAGALFDAAGMALGAPAARAYLPRENLSALAIVAKRGWTRGPSHAHMTLGDPFHLPRRAVFGLISLGEG